jgi:fatty acid/phospholipid biosynthesis enzyme
VIASLPPASEHIQHEAADQVIQMGDAALTAIRTKRNSSLVRGVQLLAEGAFLGA